jgi:threonine/homoserine/homoserine lactone efflux protein
MLYVLARSLAGGKREGVLSALGTFLGGMVHVLAAALGISIILTKSAAAFATVKYVGAAYLCFLGVRMILEARKDDARKDNAHTVDAAKQVACGGDVLETIRGSARPARNPLWQGVATEVFNPKTALFFLSFIPQFVARGSGHVFLQFVALGTLSVTLNTTADLIVIAFAGPLGEKIRSSAKFRRRQRTLTGAIMIGLGTYLATSESR